jgi:hypothetical protein
MTHPAIKTLVMLRHAARRQVAIRDRNADLLRRAKIIKANAIRQGDRLTEAQAQIWIEDFEQCKVETKFALIEIGKWFIQHTPDCEKLPRGDWLRALNVNESEWFTPEMQKHGEHIHNVVWLLHLENSATPDTGPLSRPLACCVEMTMFNAIKTNPKLDKFMHEQCNEMFDDRFGEWQEPTVLQRLGVAL